MKNTIGFTLLLFFSISVILPACKKEENFSNDIKELRFSADSILFDTVFTTLGTTTKRLTVYNPSNKWVKISEIRLAMGNKSNFRINIDGEATTLKNNVELAPKDSLFIFVAATIDPSNSSNPLVVTDSILFTVNNNLQDIDLVAWGQDAYYHLPNQQLQLSPTQLIKFGYAGCQSPWKNDKPHVVYGYLVVDTDSTLTIPAGTTIHMHNNAVLWVYDGGSLKINENSTALDEKVRIQGSRLEMNYQDIPGQWGAIWLSAGSKDNIIHHTEIKNGTVGIQVDTLGNSNKPTLDIQNTIISNMSSTGLFAQGSSIHAKNCVFANCGEYAAALTLGGNYEFLHCTFANYWTETTRQTPSVYISNYYVDINEQLQPRSLNKAYFSNCIIYGNQDNEMLTDKTELAEFNFLFDHCLIKIDPETKTPDENFVQLIKNSEPYFSGTKLGDYRLQKDSPAINRGNTETANLIPQDIIGTDRTLDEGPDIGAYEYINE